MDRVTAALQLATAEERAEASIAFNKALADKTAAEKAAEAEAEAVVREREAAELRQKLAAALAEAEAAGAAAAWASGRAEDERVSHRGSEDGVAAQPASFQRRALQFILRNLHSLPRSLSRTRQPLALL